MTVVYKVTSQLRTKFKEPFGALIQGTPEVTMAKLKELVESEKPPIIVSIGDVVSRNLHKHNIQPLITVIDNKFLRNKPSPETSEVARSVNVTNPQGTITEEAISAIRGAIEKGVHTHIVIDGEEDLLVLVAVLYLPDNSFVIYGQPYSGIVVVRVSTEKKAKVQQFLNEMKTSKS